MKEIVKVIHCYKGPVFHALVYTYYQTYTQDTDMYIYSLNAGKEGLFSKREFEMLKHIRRPSSLKFLLLLKVIQNCCSPSLAEYNDAIWNQDTHEECSLKSKIEHILVFLTNSYKDFMHKSHLLSEEELALCIKKLTFCVELLVQKAAELSKSKRWEEEKEKLLKMFSQIKAGNVSAAYGSVSDVVKVEAEFKSEMYEILLEKEIGSSYGSLWHLEEFFQRNQSSTNSVENEIPKHVDLNSLFEDVFETKRRLYWIVGEHGVGKSSLAAYTASSWSLKALQSFAAVFVVSLCEFPNQDFKDEIFFDIVFPLSNLVVDKKSLETWLRYERCLLIMDDLTSNHDLLVNLVIRKLDEYSNLTVIFMGRHSSVLKFYEDDGIRSKSVFLELKGYKEEEILRISENLKKDSSGTSLKERFKGNMNRIGGVVKYPTICYWAFQVWEENPGVFKDIYTGSDLMWEILAWKVRQKVKVNVKKIGPARKKFFDWLMLAGELALYCLKADFRIDTHSLEELEDKIAALYKNNGRKLLSSFFKPAIKFSLVTCFTTVSSTNKPFLEYLASWFFVDELLKNVHLSQLTNGLVNQLPLILFSAGHLERYQDEGTITIPEERRLIKTLVNYEEGSFEDFSFIQMLVAEMKGIRRLVEIVIDETEYNEEWNLNVSEVQLKPLEVLLNHVSPTRLIFLADVIKENYELPSVINYVCRVDISVWVDSNTQFTYGNTQSLDELVRPFLGEIVAPRLDLISGSLSSRMVGEVTRASATQHLVLLKLKVSSNEALNEVLGVPKLLPKLLWLEVKIDMEFNDIQVDVIKPTEVALFDVHLRRIDESDVTSLSGLLMAMHSRFTGIHLEATNLTPEGVFALLKELSKRGISLRAEKDDVNKFRRWYYPSLSSLPAWKNLTDEECLELIGHDDRNFFSDHLVVSSQFVTVLDAWNLRNYLETRANIVHFVYEASNIVFTKKLDGVVDISFKGGYREAIEDKVMVGAKVEEGAAEEGNVESAVMELY